MDPREERIEQAYVDMGEIERAAVIRDQIHGDRGVERFTSGATRNDDSTKFDYEGFLNPEALHVFAAYMHLHRFQRDGSVRDSDNWQKGIPLRRYVKSLVRHVVDLWRMERGYGVTNPDTGEPHTKQELACAIVFNAMGYLKETTAPAPVNQETVLSDRLNAAKRGMKL